MKNLIFSLAFITLLFTSCKKDKTVTHSKLSLHVNHKVDGANLAFNQYNYTNTAGNNYSVTTLKYYISSFTFHRIDNTEFKSDAVFYVDAASSKVFNINYIPVGNYNRISFVIGLIPEQNITGSLPSTTGKNNMAWPDMMGGGYHFMKFEGYFINNSSVQSSYAIHLGTNSSLVNIELNSDLNFSEENENINLSMNLNEWFANPNTFDLNNISHTMNNANGRALIVTNGADVFAIE